MCLCSGKAFFSIQSTFTQLASKPFVLIYLFIFNEDSINIMKKTFSVIICFVTLIVISAASTSYKPPRFKNLKILPKNITEAALDSIMNYFSISLGVKCAFCHVHNDKKKPGIWQATRIRVN